MAQTGTKKGIIKVEFPNENKKAFDEIIELAKKKGLSGASFGRLAMIHYAEGIKNKTVNL